MGGKQHLTWAKQSYTMIYLEYKVEVVDQVDLTNPEEQIG